MMEDEEEEVLKSVLMANNSVRVQYQNISYGPCLLSSCLPLGNSFMAFRTGHNRMWSMLFGWPVRMINWTGIGNFISYFVIRK